MLNIASLFSSYRLLALELERERTEHAETRRKAEEERRLFIDAQAKWSGRSPVFEKSLPPKVSTPIAVGPSAAQAKRYKEDKDREREMFGNGNQPVIPVVLPE